MKFIHYRAEPMTKIHCVNDQRASTIQGFKPNGFWFSIDDGWKTYCELQRFDLHKLAYAYEITFKDDARFIWLKTAADIDAFSALHDTPGRRSYQINNQIDWVQVAAHHSGIIIAPYCYERSRVLNMRTAWYNAWDCACGCVWDAKTIAGFKLLENNGGEDGIRALREADHAGREHRG